ncbi:MAG: 4-alpha-glucanotransferase, partial [Spirochaetales bacterium]|nr:4-alpha-glucanotransferase [Spirochaetales bacterium]
MNTPRSSGVLLHPTSLPGPYGVGDIGPAAARFIDWLSDAGQSVWQVLPLGPTGYGDSPYASLSSFAGNELLVSPDLLARDGLITQRELLAARVPAGERVDYGEVLPRKRALLRLAASRAIDSRWREAEREEFVRDNAFWLDDYALFSDIKAEYDAKA